MNVHRLVAPLILKKYESCYVSTRTQRSLVACEQALPGRSGGKAGKGRKAYNYVSGI